MLLRFFHIALLLLFSISCFSQIDDLQRDYFAAQNYFLNENADSAVIIWKKHTDVPEFSVRLIEFYLEKEDYYEALKYCRVLEKYDADEASYLFARAYAGMGFADEAVSYLEKHF